MAERSINTQTHFAVKLKSLREREKLTQSQLAEKLEVSRGSISYYEKMERTPDISFLVKTADYFGVSPEWLLGCSDDPLPRNHNFYGNFVAEETTGISLKAITKLGLDKQLGGNEYIDGLNKLLESEFFPKFANLIVAYCKDTNDDYYVDFAAMKVDKLDGAIMSTKSLLRVFLIETLFKILDTEEKRVRGGQNG